MVLVAAHSKHLVSQVLGRFQAFITHCMLRTLCVCACVRACERERTKGHPDFIFIVASCPKQGSVCRNVFQFVTLSRSKCETYLSHLLCDQKDESVNDSVSVGTTVFVCLVVLLR